MAVRTPTRLMLTERCNDASCGLHGTRIHYRRWGRTTGPRVLLIHAIGFDHHSWKPIIPYLEDRYQLVALDLPGHGESEKPAGADYSLRSLSARVAGFLDELGLDDAILVGNSLGGGTSLAIAERAPERVKGLALLNSVAYRAALPILGRLALFPLVSMVSPLAPSFAVRVGLETVRASWGSVTGERCSAVGRYFRSREGRSAFFQTLRQLYGADLAQMEPHYREIRCPTLVLHGEGDLLIRVRFAERLAREIPHAHYPAQALRPFPAGRTAGSHRPRAADLSGPANRAGLAGCFGPTHFRWPLTDVGVRR